LPALTVAAPDSDRRVAALVTWGWSEARALAFGEWLSRQLDTEFHGIQEEGLPAPQEFKVPV
jgi:hypothetical protein